MNDVVEKMKQYCKEQSAMWKAQANTGADRRYCYGNVNAFDVMRTMLQDIKDDEPEYTLPKDGDMAVFGTKKLVDLSGKGCGCRAISVSPDADGLSVMMSTCEEHRKMLNTGCDLGFSSTYRGMLGNKHERPI